MQFIFKTFNQLSTLELHQIYKLRTEVFVVEQNCAYQEVDEKDLKSVHVMCFENENLIAYCRLMNSGVSYNHPAIGRVVVAVSHRKKGIAKKIMLCSVDYCKQNFSASQIIISAQKYLEQFYSDLGFVQSGYDYLEDNIPHVKMILQIS